MAEDQIENNELKRLMKYSLNEFFINYHKSFDCPPPRYDRPEDMGWKMLANAIISNKTGKYRISINFWIIHN